LGFSPATGTATGEDVSFSVAYYDPGVEDVVDLDANVFLPDSPKIGRAHV